MNMTEIEEPTTSIRMARYTRPMDDRTEHGQVQDPVTQTHLSYTMHCKNVTGGWSCSVTFDDGQKRFGPRGNVYFDQLSVVPDRVALTALEEFKRGR